MLGAHSSKAATASNTISPALELNVTPAPKLLGVAATDAAPSLVTVAISVAEVSCCPCADCLSTCGMLRSTPSRQLGRVCGSPLCVPALTPRLLLLLLDCCLLARHPHPQDHERPVRLSLTAAGTAAATTTAATTATAAGQLLQLLMSVRLRPPTVMPVADEPVLIMPTPVSVPRLSRLAAGP